MKEAHLNYPLIQNTYFISGIFSFKLSNFVLSVWTSIYKNYIDWQQDATWFSVKSTFTTLTSFLWNYIFIEIAIQSDLVDRVNILNDIFWIWASIIYCHSFLPWIYFLLFHCTKSGSIIVIITAVWKTHARLVFHFSTYNLQNSETCSSIFWNVERGMSYSNNIISNKMVISALPNQMASFMQGAGSYEGNFREQQTRCGACSWRYHPSHSRWHVWVDVGLISSPSCLRLNAIGF